MDQRGPEEAGEFARDGGDDVLFGFAARGEPLIAAVQSLLCSPGMGDGRGRRALLSVLQGASDEGVMAIVPRGFHENTAQMRIARLGDRAARRLRAAGVLGGNQTDEGHQPRRGGKTARVAELGGDGERRQIVDAAEAAEPLDARAQRLEREECA